MEQRIKKLLLVFAAAALTIVIYVFLHEMGHLIVMDHPLLVSLVAMVIVGSGVALMIKKRMFQNFIAEIR